jgi:hypothetical protein
MAKAKMSVLFMCGGEASARETVAAGMVKFEKVAGGTNTRQGVFASVTLQCSLKRLVSEDDYEISMRFAQSMRPERTKG